MGLILRTIMRSTVSLFTLNSRAYLFEPDYTARRWNNWKKKNKECRQKGKSNNYLRESAAIPAVIALLRSEDFTCTWDLWPSDSENLQIILMLLCCITTTNRFIAFINVNSSLQNQLREKSEAGWTKHSTPHEQTFNEIHIKPIFISKAAGLKCLICFI